VTKTRSFILFAVIAAFAALGGALLARHFAPAPAAAVPLEAGTRLPGGREIVPFQLTDHTGAAFDNTRLAGQPGLLFFGFTYCPDVCPSTLALLAQLERDRPVPGLRTLFVTVDPARDDVPTLARYVAAFSPTMIGLRGDDAALDPLLRSLGAARARQDTPDGNYLVDHSATVYVIDARGRLAAVFTPPFAFAAMKADLQRLAPEITR
jgi:protein SCO1